MDVPKLCTIQNGKINRIRLEKKESERGVSTFNSQRIDDDV
jgi:hypothetical protein